MRGLVLGLMIGAGVLTLASCSKKEEAATGESVQTADKAPEGSPLNPKRKPGLWEQTVASEGGASMTMKVCLDEAADAKLSAFGSQAGKDACAESKVTKALDGTWTFTSTCDQGTGGVTKSEGKATGDFNSDYAVEATSTTTGAATPQMNRTTHMKMTAKWAGPCPDGMKPGDMDMGRGMVINMTGMKGMQGAAPTAAK